MSRARRIARRHGNRRLKARIVVTTEGLQSEPEYLKEFHRIHGNDSVRLEPIGVGGDPRAVVERAIKVSRELKKDPLASRDSVWAMFDRDDHVRFAEAKDLARGNGIRLAISNPCFELWGILHYQEQDAHLDRHECQRKLQKTCPAYNAGAGKVFGDRHAIEQNYLVAVERAKVSVRRREEEGDPGGSPSTTVYKLTELIRNFVHDVQGPRDEETTQA